MRAFVGPAQQQQTRAGFLPVERADMQRSVAGVVARVHVGAVEEQQLEMTRETEATGVVNLEPALRVRDADVSVVMEQQAQAVGMLV